MLTKQQLKVLRKVRRLLRNPKNWLQNDYVKNNQYCLHEAIYHCSRFASLGDTQDFWDLLRHVRESIVECGFPGYGSLASNNAITRFNDSRTRKHTHILKVLDHAIKTANAA